MSFMTTPRGGRGQWPRPSFVLLGSVLAALLILGLLLMHSLNHHGTAAAQEHPVAPVAPVAATAMDQPANAEPGPATGISAGDCAHCAGSAHLEAAAACLLIFFTALFLLRGPVPWRFRRLREDRGVDLLPARTMSRVHTLTLHELCISRT